MLTSILSQFLNITMEQAEAILQILQLEKRFAEEQTWQTYHIKPTEIKTQSDFLLFLQIVSQSKWFKGHDRSKLPEDIADENLRAAYLQLFKKFGLSEERTYDLQIDQPDFFVILGSEETQVSSRVNKMKADLLRGVIPKQQKIFGLGCNRKLGISAIASEKCSCEKLMALNQATDEMGMVSLLVQNALKELKKINKQFADLQYQAINTSSTAKDRADVNCVKTADTVVSLEHAIAKHFRQINTFQLPIKIVVYSKQPYIERQRRDMVKQLANQEKYALHVVGDEFNAQEFDALPNSINLCLGEIARIINTSFANEKLPEYNRLLNKEEREELFAIMGNRKIFLS